MPDPYVLPFGMDAVRVLHLAAGEVLEPLVAVEPATVLAKLSKPRPDLLNWRLDPAIQREWALAYFSSPTRPGVELPAKFAASQITTQEQIAKTQFPDSDVIGARRKDWTLKWQEIMG